MNTSSAEANPFHQIAVLVVDYLVATGALKDAAALRREGAKREQERQYQRRQRQRERLRQKKRAGASKKKSKPVGTQKRSTAKVKKKK